MEIGWIFPAELTTLLRMANYYAENELMISRHEVEEEKYARKFKEYTSYLIPKREEKVGSYCRVSTNSAEQLQSLTAQVSH